MTKISTYGLDEFIESRLLFCGYGFLEKRQVWVLNSAAI